MAGIKKELDEYLSSKERSSVEINIPFKLNALPFERWYSKSKVSDNSSDGFDSTVQSSWFPTMSRLQRLIAFCVFICMGIFCFTVASFYIPVLIFKARKFALLYTLGSFFFVCSFIVLWGPMACMQQMFSTERLPFTSAYLGTLLATLYSALSLQSTFLTCITAAGQIVVLIWFLSRHIPGGQSGIRFLSQLCCWASSNSASLLSSMSGSSTSLVTNSVSSAANAVSKTMQV
ncbi:uncharacterized protein [Hetaerina americana]|uniref:uncharacterized protein n=1 Tax=Hetaerina americana TaxID=62018 RepID=UPI003A7F1C5E